ncbi:MAG TPA: PEGA domain-containing protein [candidate division Zixibacteria bacterium]|nr:PEGA domain-containing protein [candidate division Zixibacteria bacterium]
MAAALDSAKVSAAESVPVDSNGAAAALVITSDPPGGSIVFADQSLSDPTPHSLTVDTGNYQIEVYLDGFEPLAHSVVCDAGDSIVVHFILRPLPPGPVDPDSLGLMYLPQQPLIDSTLADRQMRSYSQAAEFFAVFPLAQGLLIKAFLGGDRNSEANLMIGAGVGLSLGSLALGRIVSSHKRNSIRERNEELQLENEAAVTNNQLVDRELQAASDERQQVWELENRQRGRVSVTRRERASGP